MAYKDKEKQRTANREASRRYRAKGMTQKQGMTVGMTPNVHDSMGSSDVGVVSALHNLVRPDGISDSRWNYIQFKAKGRL